MADFFIFAGVFALSLLLIFLPSKIAIDRKHKERRAITVLACLSGWTLAGWVIAMVWANTSNTENESFNIPAKEAEWTKTTITWTIIAYATLFAFMFFRSSI